MATPFWLSNIQVLYDRKYLLEIIPNKKYDMNRKLNSMVRFSIYFSLLSYLLRNDKNVFCLPFIVLVITTFVHRNYKQDKKEELEQKMVKPDKSDSLNKDKVSTTIDNIIDNIDDTTEYDVCKLPNNENPFMNLNLMDVGTGKDITPACDSYNNEYIKEKIEDKFNNKLFKDTNDIFNTNNSQSRFYTMPNTDIINDQEKFMNWCYKTPPTCKEGNGLQCTVGRGSGHNGGGTQWTQTQQSTMSGYGAS